MTCKEIIEFLMDYDSGELQPAVRTEFDRHLAMCPPCVRYMKSYRETISLSKECCCSGEAEKTPIPDELVKAILASLKKKA